VDLGLQRALMSQAQLFSLTSTRLLEFLMPMATFRLPPDRLHCKQNLLLLCAMLLMLQTKSASANIQ
jgi:hypothetical protein